MNRARRFSKLCMGLYLTQILRLHKIVYYDGDFADMCHEKNSLKFIDHDKRAQRWGARAP